MTDDSSEEILVRKIRSLPKVVVQNHFMRLSDRHVALVIKHLGDEDRSFLLSLLPRSMAERVGEELALHRRLKISHAQHRQAVDQVISALSGERGDEPGRTYLRPVKKRS